MSNTITLNVASVRDFQKRVQFIPRNDLKPILKNIKLQHYPELGWRLIKNNENTVCIGRVQAEGEPATILLDERIFFGLVTAANGEVVTLEVLEGKLWITIDGQKTDLPIEDPADFPREPPFPIEQEPLQFTEQHLRAIRIAANFTSPGETAGNFQFVHLTPTDGIFGFHNNFFYINSAFSGGVFPEVQFRPDECEIICSTEGVGFINMDRHHVFFNGGYTYIFTKSEAKALNITGVVERLQQPGNAMVINRDGLVDFCATANLVSETPLADCLISPMGGALIRLTLRDNNYNRGTERMLPCQGEPEMFAFNSRLLAPVLKVIPYEQLEGKTNNNCLIIGGKNGTGNGLAAEVNEWFVFIGMQKERPAVAGETAK